MLPVSVSPTTSAPPQPAFKPSFFAPKHQIKAFFEEKQLHHDHKKFPRSSFDDVWCLMRSQVFFLTTPSRHRFPRMRKEAFRLASTRQSRMKMSRFERSKGLSVPKSRRKRHSLVQSKQHHVFDFQNEEEEAKMQHSNPTFTFLLTVHAKSRGKWRKLPCFCRFS